MARSQMAATLGDPGDGQRSSHLSGALMAIAFRPIVGILLCLVFLEVHVARAQSDLLSPEFLLRVVGDEWNRYSEQAPQFKCKVRRVDSSLTPGVNFESTGGYDFEKLGEYVLAHIPARSDTGRELVVARNADYSFCIERPARESPWVLLGSSPANVKSQQLPNGEILDQEIDPTRMGMKLSGINILDAIEEGIFSIESLHRIEHNDVVLKLVPNAKNNFIKEATVRLSASNHWLVSRARYSRHVPGGFRQEYSVSNSYENVAVIGAKALVKRETTEVLLKVGNEDGMRTQLDFSYSELLPIAADFRLPRFGLEETVPAN